MSRAEAEELRDYLRSQRAMLRSRIDGVDVAGLAATLPPSTMTLGGLAKHLACVEDWWCGEMLLGLPASEPWASVDWEADEDWDWHSAAEDSPEELLALFDRFALASETHLDTAIAAGGLDHPTARPVHRLGGPVTTRWVVLHLIEEHARHLGHADLLREAVDGTRG